MTANLFYSKSNPQKFIRACGKVPTIHERVSHGSTHKRISRHVNPRAGQPRVNPRAGQPARRPKRGSRLRRTKREATMPGRVQRQAQRKKSE